ncbi:NAD(P)/FAD-dependent oxidoreductase [Cupriavidus taiwanensis]|uniref:Opine oxidase subunit A pyridine nucleotide-disulphide oxidoreductase n=1 Tax=Cupriavidus taiwanensis TaxID=164546 RepID=A0A7Z7JGA9_9BURK|nr:NAD(P)/FAD-dependent oxidoreductase [Cupriavidus taiwanensis]SOZ10645.1 Opine oxidase subunit A; pyridine nucleotide-disulphide oxidoreductase [Cupriavidus taiwanensis]SOZ12827.1 Opine oxidase subunit A; pyridine nucleotide-disulphide oxidoreductase [Cupriavidus taiwanensis]SOZ41322.1 Opine oxidase subunit A; pyridine nucleotide-disulphide oxidoreductase [Cupriavidus taiwanensis]SPC23627.1 Opine oxidase subunit A; pyridine nucleotide-disulphide oxidoreductase [Cupriavidus taiwanensis]SPD548
MAEHDVDIAIIGAGPAGMAAAVAAAASGARVALLDEQEACGGQIYRGILSAPPERLRILGPDYAAGRALADRFAASGAQHITGAAVWQVTREHAVHYLREGRVASLQARQVILCTGAMERPFPIPGWTLPGVLTAGAAQILLKSADVVPAEPVVLAGCGPLLYLLGWQYVRAGVPIRAIVDTTDGADYQRALAHLGGALAGWRYLKKGLALMRALKRGGVPFYKGATALSVEGDEAVRALRFTSRGQSHRIATQAVLLHQGVVPNTQFTWALRAAHRWDDRQLCWQPVVDDWGALDLPGTFVAGDGRGIGGAVAAALQGELAGLAAAHNVGRVDAAQRDRQAAPLRAALRAHLGIRPFLDALYRPKPANRVPADDVVVCRCEEVTAGAIRGFVALGCSGPNQAKSFGRCGMGPCQGRQCGLTVTEIIADARGVPPHEVGYYRIRPPIKPVTLGELANEG